MLRIPLNLLLEKHPDLWNDFLRSGQLNGGELLFDEIENPELHKKCVHCPPATCEKISIHKLNISVTKFGDRPILKTLAIPEKDWPLKIKALKLLARETDQGIGDIIERIIGPIGGNAFKKWHQETFDRDCGCGDRKAKLNAFYPLKTAAEIPKNS